MPDVKLEATVPLPPQQAFDVFVGGMDVWWPRRGVFPYSFAPETTRPLHIQFDERKGGRYYETFADGSEYVIGAISVWNPPAELAYSWRDPTWPGSTDIRLQFAPARRRDARVVHARRLRERWRPRADSLLSDWLRADPGGLYRALPGLERAAGTGG